MPDALFEYLNKKFNRFVVQNITPDRSKTIHLFGYPIPYLQKRDLLAVPAVDSSVIQDSLSRGVLRNRILARDILVLQSDINLQEFNLDQKDFLKSAGIVIGIEQANAYKVKTNEQLTGLFNGISRQYYFPEIVNYDPQYPNDFAPVIMHNGRTLDPNGEYRLVESNGSGTGYDSIFITSFAPNERSNLMSNYYVKL